MTAAGIRIHQVPHWATLSGRSTKELRSEVERLEAAGITGVMAIQAFEPPWAKLAAAAMCSSTIELASGIALGFTRSPVETAAAALDLDRLSGGRFTLGLGTSLRAWNVERFGVPYDRPLARLRELVAIVRQLVNADAQRDVRRFDGEFWQLDLRNHRLPTPVRPTIPIALAPLRERMTELAAELGDVVLGHPMWTTSWIEGGAQRALARGLERAGRERGDIRVIATVRVAITDDVEQGLADAKIGIPYFAAHRQYDSYFEEIGLADNARQLQTLAARGGSPTELIGAVSDEMANALTMVGSAEDVRSRLNRLLDHVDELQILPPVGAPGDRALRYAEQIDEHLRPRA